METFTLNIVADTKTVFSAPARYCKVTTLSGSMGFEASHESFLGVLMEDSEISYSDSAGNNYSVTLESGIISFKNNTCTITGVLPVKPN